MQMVVLNIRSWRGKKARPDLAARVQDTDTGRVSVIEDLAGDSLAKIRSATVRAYQTHARLSWPGPTGRWVHDAHLDRWLTAIRAEEKHWHDCLNESQAAYRAHYDAAPAALRARMLPPDALDSVFAFHAYYLPTPTTQEWQAWREDCLGSAMAELPERLVGWLSKIIETGNKSPKRLEALLAKIMPDVVAASDVAHEAGDWQAIALMQETQDVLLSASCDSDKLVLKCKTLLSQAKALQQQHEEG
jgi:hypothetical protein